MLKNLANEGIVFSSLETCTEIGSHWTTIPELCAVTKCPLFNISRRGREVAAITGVRCKTVRYIEVFLCIVLFRQLPYISNGCCA